RRVLFRSWASRTGQRFRAVLSGSAIGYYGSFAGLDAYPLHEQDSAGQDFAARLCADWEDAAQPLAALSERSLVLRTGVVLGQQGGMLKRLRLPFSLGLGDRKSTRLNSSHVKISYAVFCLK